MFEFLRRIPEMLKLTGRLGRTPTRSGAVGEGSPAGASGGAESSAPSKPRRPKSPSQRRSGPKPKSGGGRPKRKK